MSEADMLNAYGARKIVTSYIFPPIPDRNHDWCCYFDGDEESGNYGYGRTEAAAIRDFIDNLDDEEEQLQLAEAYIRMRSAN